MSLTKDKIIKYGLLIFNIAFYLLFFFVDGVQETADTNGYVIFNISREPLYPVLLAFFRSVFGVENYFSYVGLFQCLLWGVVTWYVSISLRRYINGENYLSFIFTVIFTAVTLLTRFGATRKALYALDLATEGITMPLFYLFVLFLLGHFLLKENKYLICTICCAILLILTRKQMYIVIPIMGIAYLLMMLLKQIKFKKMIILWCLTIGAFGASILLDIGYNYVVRGKAVRHTSDSAFLLITTLYSSDAEDNIYFEDENIKDLFEQVIEERDTQKWGYDDAPSDMFGMAGYYADHYDLIYFEIVNPFFYDYLTEHGIDDYLERELVYNELTDYMISCLFAKNISKISYVFISNSVVGFCNTVAKSSKILIPAVVLVYMIYIGLIGWFGKKDRACKEFIIASVVMICIVVNVLAVSIMIFSQSRYMIYNMPFFYCAAYLMLYRVVADRWRNKVGKNG